MKKFLWISLLIVLTGVALLYAQTESLKKPLSIDKADKVLVLKSKREMQLLKGDRVLGKYKIALGRNPEGHKVQEGDMPTPEGHYILDWRNPNSSCYKSLHISYPNHQDKENARKLGVSPGGDIMIHGLYPTLKYLGSKHVLYDWTYGCIAVTNEEMDEIWQSVKNGTPIEIRK